MSNLDDFFKKRDKKKKTTAKSKFDTLSTDQLCKNLKSSDNASEPAVSLTSSSTEAPVTQNSTSPKVTEIDSDTAMVTTSHQSEQTSTTITTTSESRRKNGNGEPEEEWKPFDEGETRDYSGLRINTQGWKVEDDEEEQVQAGDNDEAEQPNNAWGSKGSKKPAENETAEEEEESANKNEDKKEQSTKETTETLVEEKKEEKLVPKKEEEAPAPYIPPSMRNRMAAAGESTKPATAPTPSSNDSGSGSSAPAPYVPPSMRHRTVDQREPASSGIPTSSVNYRRPNKKEPNLSDTLEFPSLGGMGGGPMGGGSDDSGLTNGNNKFEMPKKSGKGETKAAATMIDVENKFSALGNN